MSGFKRLILFVLCLAHAVILTGCAVTPGGTAGLKLPKRNDGIYHRVEKGETLWRLSRMYGVELNEITRINRIQETTPIEIGQLIFIPTGQKFVSAPVLQISESEDFIWPVKGRVSSSFGQSYNNLVNRGINIKPQGNRDVHASRSGSVVFLAENFGNYGHTVIIGHGGGFYTVYSCLKDISVKAGDTVRRGERIASVAKSGTATQEFLHFQIRKENVAQNPYFYLP